MEIVPSIPPSEGSPGGLSRDAESDVQRVRVVRKGDGQAAQPPGFVADDDGQGEAEAGPTEASVGGSAYISINASSASGAKSVSVVGIGKRTFFPTVKRVLLLGLVLAFLAAWYADRGNVLRGVLAAVLVFVPSIGVAVALASRLAAANLAVDTWRKTGLVMRVLDALLDRMVGTTGTELATRQPAVEGSPGDAAPAAPRLGVLPLPEAQVRLKRAAEAWTNGGGLSSAVGGSSPALGGLIGRARRWMAGLVEPVAQRALQRIATGGQVDLVAVRAYLVERIDDAVAARVRATNRSAAGGAVLALLAWSAFVAYAVNRLWS